MGIILISNLVWILKPFIQYEKFADNFVAPIQNFCEARFVTILNKFKELTNPSKGLEIGLLSTGLIYRVLFENGQDYVSASVLTSRTILGITK